MGRDRERESARARVSKPMTRARVYLCALNRAREGGPKPIFFFSQSSFTVAPRANGGTRAGPFRPIVLLPSGVLPAIV